MHKFTTILFVLAFVNCTSQIHTPVTLHTQNGQSIRMAGYKITIINDGVDQVMLASSIAWINEQLGFRLLTIDPGNNQNRSVIFIDEDILPYEHPDDNEVIGYRSDTILGRASFDVPEDGIIRRCDITINYFIPGPRVRRDVMRHEILHCLGLRDSSDWHTIMNGDLAGFRPPIDDRSLKYLRMTYINVLGE